MDHYYMRKIDDERKVHARMATEDLIKKMAALRVDSEDQDMDPHSESAEDLFFFGESNSEE